MTKANYFNKIESQAIKNKLFLTNRTDLLDKEISENLWSFSLTKELAEQVSPADFLDLFDKICANGQKQLNVSDLPLDLIYYLWHDEQAGQLRLNFINSNHKKLPFGCILDFVESESEIIQGFLKSEYMVGIPMVDFRDIDTGENEEEIPYTLKVFKRILKKEQ